MRGYGSYKLPISSLYCIHFYCTYYFGNLAPRAHETCTVSHNSDAKNNVAYTPGAMTLQEMVFVFCALQAVVSLLLLGIYRF